MDCPSTSMPNSKVFPEIDLCNLGEKSNNLPQNKISKFSLQKFEDCLENHLDEETIDYLVDFWVLHDCRAEGVSKIEQQLIKTSHEFEERNCVKTIRKVRGRSCVKTVKKVRGRPRKKNSSSIPVSNSTSLKRDSSVKPENHADNKENESAICSQLPLRGYPAQRILQQQIYFPLQERRVSSTVSLPNQVGNEYHRNEYHSQTQIHGFASPSPFPQQSISSPLNQRISPTIPSPNHIRNRQQRSEYHSLTPLQSSSSSSPSLSSSSPSPRPFQQHTCYNHETCQISTPVSSPNQVRNLQHNCEYYSQMPIHEHPPPHYAPPPRPFQLQRYSPHQS
ncbi:UNVERIFIED_CONTAM: hypothetical protein RMT77_002200 [Armadillidium vulgare]